jgi:CRISPR-associated protein Csd1
MILQALNELYDRLANDPNYEIAAPGFSPQKISFRIVLKRDGALFAIEDARAPDVNGRLQKTVMLVPGEAKPSGAGINPCLLWDNQTYLIGRQPEDKAPGFGLIRFEAFRKRHLDLMAVIQDPAFTAVCRFLEQWSPQRISEFPILDEVGDGFGIFTLQGEKQPIHETKRFQDWWRASQEQGSENEIQSAQCLLTGIVGPVARLHPKIKGVKGAQSSGATIVSFNATAYESFGKTQSYNAPVGQNAAFQYGTALNSLLSGPQSQKHHIRIGDTTTVFWTARPTIIEDVFADLFSSGSHALEEVQDLTRRAQIQKILEAVRSGTRYEEQGNSQTPFYILGLAPNAARIAIRFCHRSTITELVDNLHNHHENFQMVREYTQPSKNSLPDPDFPAIWQILKETARAADEIPPLLGGAITRSIVDGAPYPEGLFTAIIRRIRADRTINYLRAATLKAVLKRNHQITILNMLDLTNTDPAYLLGRLFAALEKTQDDALGGVNAGIRDRFYSAASATPASVFPRLLRTYQHHLSKLNGGAKVNRERLVQEILSTIKSTGFPNHFPLKQQGVFAIGYYHQRRDFFTKKDKASNPDQND